MTGTDGEGSQVLVSSAERTPTNRRTHVQLCLMSVWHLGGLADEEEARGIPEKRSLSVFLPRRGAHTLSHTHSLTHRRHNTHTHKNVHTPAGPRRRFPDNEDGLQFVHLAETGGALQTAVRDRSGESHSQCVLSGFELSFPRERH